MAPGSWWGSKTRRVRSSWGRGEVEVSFWECGCFNLKTVREEKYTWEGLPHRGALLRPSKKQHHNIEDGDDHSVFQIRSLQQNHSWNRNSKLYYNEGNSSSRLPSPRAHRVFWSAKRCAYGGDARPLWVEAEPQKYQ